MFRLECSRAHRGHRWYRVRGQPYRPGAEPGRARDGGAGSRQEAAAAPSRGHLRAHRPHRLGAARRCVHRLRRRDQLRGRHTRARSSDVRARESWVSRAHRRGGAPSGRAPHDPSERERRGPGPALSVPGHQVGRRAGRARQRRSVHRAAPEHDLRPGRWLLHRHRTPGPAQPRGSDPADNSHRR